MYKHSLISLLLTFSATLCAQSFNAQGSDLLIGIGAKNIATASASTANTNDVYAIYYNPAGLSEIKSGQFAISTQVDAKLGYVNFLGIAYAFPIESLNLKVAVALAYIPRLYIQSSGKYLEDDIESVFLRYTLPGLSPNFDGEIESKTNDYRFAVAFSELHNPSWSFGVSAGYVNCATTFAGVTLEDPTNFTYMSTVAKAIAFGVGAKYYVNKDLTLGLNMRNLDSKLTVQVDTTDDDGTTSKSYDVDMPYDFSIGANWKYSEDLTFASDYQQVFGAYGDYEVDFKLLRFGTTINSDLLDYHLGLVVPITLSSSKADTPDLPFPMSPTAGMGWHNDSIDFSLAFYVHPIMSMHLNKPSPSLDLSMSYNF